MIRMLSTVFLVFLISKCFGYVGLNLFNLSLKNKTKMNDVIQVRPNITIPTAYQQIISTTWFPEIFQHPAQTNLSTIGISLNHEFEEESGEEYPSNDECLNATVIYGIGQEIDETRNCSSNSTAVTTEIGLEIDESNVEADGNEDIKKQNFRFSLGSFMAPVLKLPIIEIPAFPKVSSHLRLTEKTITLTNFINRLSTVYEAKYPTCLIMDNVKSVCDGKLITIQPTRTMENEKTKYKRGHRSVNRINTEIKKTFLREKHEVEFTQKDNNLLRSLRQPHSFMDSLLEPSELDYEFEEISTKKDSKHTFPTPNLKNEDKSTSESSRSITPMMKSKGNLKIERIDEIFFTFTTIIHSNYFTTATVLIQNCIPPHINYPLCSSNLVYEPVENISQETGILEIDYFFPN